LTGQLADAHGEFEVEKQTLISKHEYELKRKDAKMTEKELSAFQNLSLVSYTYILSTMITHLHLEQDYS
jgi:hypothetical protein